MKIKSNIGSSKSQKLLVVERSRNQFKAKSNVFGYLVELKWV